MSVRAMSWVWEFSHSTGSDLIVLLKIADRANDEGQDAWPSVATLVKHTRLSKSTVLRSLERLESSGELQVERRGLGQTNRYTLTFHPGDFERCQDDTTSITDEPETTDQARCQSDTTRCQSEPGVNLTPHGVTGDTEVVSLVTPNTSCTSSTHTPRAREDDEPPSDRSEPVPLVPPPSLPPQTAGARMPLIARGEALAYDESQRKLHRGCHPEVCRWRGLRATPVRMCMPAVLVDEFASKLVGVEHNAAIADVIAWAQTDSPPPGYVAQGDTFKFWRHRWDTTRASAPPKPQNAARDGTPTRAVPDAEATDRLLDELARGGR